MKYYEMHEIVYKKLKEEGEISWSKDKDLSEMLAHDTNIFIQKFVPSLNGKRVLDLGTGTGTSALFSALNGADVVGIDISNSAIELAEANAKKLNLQAKFITGDVLNLDLKEKFDLIIDSTILHCLVGTKDRSAFYDTVKRHLKEDGIFFVNTMSAVENMESKFSPQYFLFDSDILWSLGISDIENRKVFNGKSYFPHRTILPLDKQLQEFSLNGFRVIKMEENVKEGEVANLAALLQLD